MLRRSPGSIRVDTLYPYTSLVRSGDDVAMITDGRFGGATHGFLVGHISPEAAHGGPIAWLRNGDTVRIDVARRRIDVAADLGKREPRRIAPRVTTGAL